MTTAQNRWHDFEPSQLLSQLNIARLLDALQPAWITGGTLRDSLFHLKDLLSLKNSNCIDVATALPFDAMVRILERLPCTVRTTNRQHLSANIFLDSTLSADITCLRIDTATDGRHATTRHTTDLETDSRRRDFSVNALYLSLDGKIFDFHHGLDDLKNRRLRFIGDPDVRISQDILRLLRFLRFLSPFQDEKQSLEPDFLSVCKKHVPRLTLLSKMRKSAELLAILRNKRPSTALELMNKLGIMAGIYFPLCGDVPSFTSQNINERLLALLQCTPNPQEALNSLELLRKDRKFILARLQNDGRDAPS